MLNAQAGCLIFLLTCEISLHISKCCCYSLPLAALWKNTFSSCTWFLSSFGTCVYWKWNFNMSFICMGFFQFTNRNCALLLLLQLYKRYDKYIHSNIHCNFRAQTFGKNHKSVASYSLSLNFYWTRKCLRRPYLKANLPNITNIVFLFKLAVI